ncbi:MAG: hypothetical protein GQ574_17865 [Crocinitomix sp.]|nr:hypothetical protein [Crocinitomix sp.]
MSEEKNDFAKGLEGIFKKMVDINKDYFKQGKDLVSEARGSGKKAKAFKAPESGEIMGALSAFAELNIEHYKNVMELGFEFTKNAFSNTGDTSEPTEPTDPTDPKDTVEEAEVEEMTVSEDYVNEPAFILTGTGCKEGVLKFQFLLDNIKEEKVLCKFVNFDFVNVDDPTETYALKTDFEPQSFSLEMNASQAVAISVTIDSDMKLGTYQSKVQVEGFEPLYFLIRIIVVRKNSKLIA